MPAKRDREEEGVIDSDKATKLETEEKAHKAVLASIVNHDFPDEPEQRVYLLPAEKPNLATMTTKLQREALKDFYPKQEAKYRMVHSQLGSDLILSEEEGNLKAMPNGIRALTENGKKQLAIEAYQDCIDHVMLVCFQGQIVTAESLSQYNVVSVVSAYVCGIDWKKK